MLKHPLDPARLQEIVKNAVDIEKEFRRRDALVRARGHERGSHVRVHRVVADRLMTQLGMERVWNTPNPFEWMEMISLRGKANFFEHRVDQYQKANVMTSVQGKCDGFENYVFGTDLDF